ncbi:MAG TPA: ParB/RepB/Spo0J family partition protein [Mycobacteriales bacterium]|jgi:ParB family chromosome partitioning protein|nr:ParB/RepB/Spo0J family partition protein [Mycobacteriales bacterium]
MNVRRGGLGRGLGALIPSGPIEEEEGAAGARFEEVPIDSIEPNPRQPREVFDDDALAELVTSVREVGVLQPVVVREIGPGRYQLVMGERRWRACREAGLTTMPAIIRDTPDDALLRDALLENLHRQQLNPLEEAAAYQQLLQEFGATHDELADRIGRSRSQVSNTIRLLGLPPTVQRRVGAGVLSAGHARALLGLADAETQERFAARIVAEGLSVRATEELVATSERPAQARVRAQHAPKAPALARLEASLSDLLETRVTVELGRRHGKLIVAFASLEDLQRVLGVLAPQVLSEDSFSDDALDLTGAFVTDATDGMGSPGTAE